MVKFKTFKRYFKHQVFDKHFRRSIIYQTKPFFTVHKIYVLLASFIKYNG